MNKRDLRPIHKELLRDLPGFASHKSLLLMSPTNGMLRAIDFDPSGFSKDDFDVRAIVMPLCAPSDHIVLTLGVSLNPSGPPRGWRLSMPDLIELIRRGDPEGCAAVSRFRPIESRFHDHGAQTLACASHAEGGRLRVGAWGAHRVGALRARRGRARLRQARYEQFLAKAAVRGHAKFSRRAASRSGRSATPARRRGRTTPSRSSGPNGTGEPRGGLHGPP